MMVMMMIMYFDILATMARYGNGIGVAGSRGSVLFCRCLPD